MLETGDQIATQNICGTPILRTRGTRRNRRLGDASQNAAIHVVVPNENPVRRIG